MRAIHSNNTRMPDSNKEVKKHIVSNYSNILQRNIFILVPLMNKNKKSGGKNQTSLFGDF